MSGIILLILRIAFSIGLFAFLGWSLWLIWRDLKGQSNAIDLQQPPLLILQNAGEGDPQESRFLAPEVLIGRDPLSDFVINDNTVSIHHSRLAFRQGHWWVEDLGSTNGTFINQDPISSPVVLTDGDQLRCGQITLNIKIGHPLGE